MAETSLPDEGWNPYPRGSEIDPSTGLPEVPQNKSKEQIIVLFLGTWIRKLKKMTNDELKDAIDDTWHVNKALNWDNSKEAQKEKMKHDIAKDEQKNRK